MADPRTASPLLVLGVLLMTGCSLVQSDSSGEVLVNRIGTAVLAAGALGTAAFGIVDGLKLIPWIDLAGFGRLFSGARQRGRVGGTSLLDPLLEPLRLAYGAAALDLMKAQYRNGRAKGDLPRTLRQGVRIGLGMMDARSIAAVVAGVGLPDTADEAAAAIVLARGQRPPAAGEAEPRVVEPLPEKDRATIARVETAIDARIDASLTLAETVYVGRMKVLASAVAVGIALVAGALLGQGDRWAASLVVGLAAVPLAPIAHDVATALQQAVKALKRS